MLTEQERAFWKQQADAGVKPDEIPPPTKAQRVVGAPAPTQSAQPAAQIEQRPRGRRGDELFQPDPSPAGAVDTRGDRVSPGGLAGVVRGDGGDSWRGPVGLGEAISRGAGRVAGLGFGPAIEAGIDTLAARARGLPGTFNETLRAVQQRNAAAQTQHPTASQLAEGTAAGLMSLAPVGAAGEALGAGARIATGAATGALQGGAQAAGDYVSDPDRGGTADAISRIATGANLGGAVGAALPALGAAAGRAARAVTNAPERVGQRILTNISRGEAGGVAKGKAVGNMLAKAGDEGADLLRVVEGAGLTKSLATKAAAHPGKALKDVEKVLAENERNVLGPVYDAINEAGTGPDVTTLGNDLLDHANKLRAAGDMEKAEAVDRYVTHLDRNYKPDQKLGGAVLRKLRGTIGGGAFNNLADENTPLGQQVKREIYGVYSRAIEGAAAKTPGVDVAALKAGNQRASQLLGVSEVLADRAAKATAGGSTLSNAIMHGGFHAGLAGALGHALWKGNPSEIAAILAAEGGLQFVKRVPQMLRHVDLSVSRSARAKAAADVAQELVRRLGNRAAPAAIAAGAARSAPDTSDQGEEAGDE